MILSKAPKFLTRAAGFAATLCVISVFPSAAFAQAVSQISGTVKDSSGAVIAGLQVTATQTDTDFRRTSVRDDSGSYVLTNLPLGSALLAGS